MSNWKTTNQQDDNDSDALFFRSFITRLKGLPTKKNRARIFFL